MNGYTPVPVVLSTKKPLVTHYLYVRQHSSKGSDDSTAVFVAGLPNDTTIDNLKDLCTAMGSVILENFEYQGQNRGLLHLVDQAACDRFLAKAGKAVKSKSATQWALYGPRGSAAYVLRNNLRYPEEADLEQDANEYMENFAAIEADIQRAREEEEEKVDEDGFKLVINTKRKTLAAPGETVASGPLKKQKSKEKSDFYRFQLREQRKQEMNNLLKQFQADKEKVSELQRKKLLRPY